MNKNNVVGLKGRDTITDALTEMLQSGAQELIQQAVQVELEELLQQYTARLTTEGNAAVVRNGYLPERKILTGIGPVTVKIPKVRAKSGEPVTFHSALVPPYVRKTQSIEAALPWLYLKGISTGEMEAALTVLVGPEAQGTLRQYDFTAQARMGTTIPTMARDAIGQRPMGLHLGRRDLFRTEVRRVQALRPGDYWCQ